MTRSSGMMQKLVCGCGVFAAILIATALPAHAQTGSVRGILRDASGGALPGVTVTLTDEKSGAETSAVSGGDGG